MELTDRELEILKAGLKLLRRQEVLAAETLKTQGISDFKPVELTVIEVKIDRVNKEVILNG